MVASLAFALESLRMLIKSQDVLVASGEATAADVATYAGLTKQAMGSVGDVVCRVMNVVTCFGITISYLIFIAETCKVVVPALVGAGPFGAAPTTASMLQLIAPAMIGLSWLREMSGVAVISAVGTASVVIGMLVTTIDALGNPLQIAALPTWNFAAFPGFFGTVAFLFFIHFTLFGIKEAMPQPDKFFPAAVKAFTGAAAIAGVFGVAGAVGYGTSVSSVVVTMLSGPSGIAVQLLLCLNLMSTYPIMAQSALRICEDLFKGKSGSVATPTSIGVRTAFTAGALWTAANVPNFGVVLGYVGGVCCSILSLVLPATILYIAQNKVKNEITANELARIATVFVTGITCIVLSIVL
jgi:proton-coupled amino acid transporter